MRGEHLLTYLKRQNPKAILFTEEFADRITEIKDQLEGVERYIVVGEKAPAEAILYEDLISRSPDKMPEETSFITSFSYSTGGTTGVPKHTNYYDMWGYALSDIAEAPRVSFGEYLKHLILGLYFSYCYGKPIMEENDNIRCLVPTPMHHAATSVGWLPPFLFMGGTIVPMSRFDAEEFLRLTERERCNWTFVVPTMLQRILALPDEVKRKYDLSSMRSLICASAPCPIETKRGINELFMQQGCKKPVYCEYYGSSETGVITVLLPEDYLKNPKCIESVGSPRCGDLRIFNDEEKRICSPNEIGKVMVRTNSTIQLRYYGTPEKLQNVLKTIDGKEFFDDELLGYVDKDDFLYLTGREKEMIIVGGVNIYPDEVEKAVLGYPKVLETAIIPIPDKDLGEVVGCVVQPKKGEKITEEEIIEYCKKKGLYGYAVPRKVEIMEELPRSMGGKMLKDEIMKKYWEDKGIKRRG
jgi:long-chain acyl-CoA synthetase